MDFILLEDDELQEIFEVMNRFQIIFHPYYSREGKLEHYNDFLRNKKNKIIILDRNMVSMISGYFENGELACERNMIMILFFLLYCNINRLQYNFGLAMNEYADSENNSKVINQLNGVLTYISEFPSMLIKEMLKTENYKISPIKIPVKFQRDYNYKFKSDFYLVSYCSILKASEIFLKKELSKKEMILQYLDWYYDNLILSKYDITYAILLFINYPQIKAPKNINGSYDEFIKGCKNQAWDISYLTTINNLQQNSDECEYFFATNDSTLKLIFMVCNNSESSWGDIIYDRLSKKDKAEIFNLINLKMKKRIKPLCNNEKLIELANQLEENIKKKKMT